MKLYTIKITHELNSIDLYPTHRWRSKERAQEWLDKFIDTNEVDKDMILEVIEIER